MKEQSPISSHREKVRRAVTVILSPWLSQPEVDGLPKIQTVEIARRTGLSSAKVLKELSSSPLGFSVDSQNYQTALIPESIKPDNGLENFYSLVSAKRIIKGSREFAFRNGSRVIDRARFDKAKLARVALIKARERVGITLEKSAAAPSVILEQKPLRKKQMEKDWEYLMSVDNLPTEKAPQVLDTLRYFEVHEFNRRPISNRAVFLEKLVNLARGIPEIFLVFNCFRFSWEERGKNYPAAKIDVRTELTPAMYHKQTVIETAKILSQLGPALIILVVPDSEAKDSRLWQFAQSQEERETLITTVKQNLGIAFTEITTDKKTDSPVLSWSELCNALGLPKPSIYTTMAYNKIKQNPSLLSELETICVPEDDQYLTSYGINPKLINYQEKFERVLWYYSMYYGEGVAASDMGAVIINIEDFRVTQWMQHGADKKLVVVSPTQDIYTYYAWRKEQLQKLHV